MWISHLELINYKNLNLTATPTEGINLLIAPNGAGKTNFLEAIDYVATTSSFRGIGDEYIFPEGGEVSFSAVGMQVEYTDTTARGLKLVLSPEKGKQYFSDGQKTSAAKLKSHLKTLVHAPNTLDLVSGPASLRRNFLDGILKTIYPSFKKISVSYAKAIYQKNKLLQSRIKGINGASNQNYEIQLDFWNKKIVELGSRVTTERLSLLQLIKPFFAEIAAEIYNLKNYKIGFELESKYIQIADVNNLLAQKDEVQQIAEAGLTQKIFDPESYAKEGRVGTSLYGPHRDDFLFTLNAKSVRFASSRGQQRIFSLILHLSLLELLESEYSEKVVLLLDDILSELDEIHRDNTYNFLKNYLEKEKGGQAFLTMPDATLLKAKHLKKANLISIT